jgi:16S rRNA (guanine(966)-N(2))-methyltransferase RsmD
VREALFSILEARGVVSGARVIDFYAGTGALGLEALSRGAAFATFVESDRAALTALGRNVEALGEGTRARILPYTATRALSALAHDTASLAFLDPPYAEVMSGRVVQMLASLARDETVGDGATIVLEHATRDRGSVEAMAAKLPGLRAVDSRTYGDTSLTLYLCILPPP